MKRFANIPLLILAVGLAASVSAGTAVPTLPDLFKPGSVILFQGDSITDGGHLLSPDMNHFLAHGYQAWIGGRYLAYRPEDRYVFINRGVSGNTSSNLVERWHTDAMPVQPFEHSFRTVFEMKPEPRRLYPDYISILIGINDYTRRPPWRIPPEATEASVHYLITNSLAIKPDVKLIIAEPFRLPVNSDPDFVRRQAAVAKLCARYKIPCVPFQRLFSEDLMRIKPHASYWFWDKFHPTPMGHLKMADFWIDFVSKWYARPPTNAALVPVAPDSLGHNDWYERHRTAVDGQKALDPEIVLVGDETASALKAEFVGRRVLDLGFPGDRIENVLWRLAHGEMDDVVPKTVVVSAGGRNPPSERTEGLAELARRCREKVPSACVEVR